MKQSSLSRGKLCRSAPVALFLFAALSAPQALACADVGCSPSWKLKHAEFSGCDNTAFLNPGNDSRINLQLLVADLQSAKGRPPLRPAGDAPVDKAMFTFDEFAAAYDPAAAAPDGADTDLAAGEGSRCVSNRGGTQAFTAAVTAARGLSAGERAALIQARTALAPTCLGGAQKAVASIGSAVGSAQARQFAAYLLGAAAFYDSDFDAAHQQFAALSGSPSPWLKEASRYMLARVELNRAQVGAFGDYGELSRDKVDAKALAAADAGFEAYLRDYPNGAYAASARGLLRRVYWLGGQSQKLAGAFGWQFANLDLRRTNVTVSDLVQEVDNKLGAADATPAAIDNPQLLAAMDLQRMRRPDASDPGAAPSAPALSLADLQAQKPVFAAHPALFAYLLAVHRLYVENDPAGALKLLPASGAEGPSSNLAYSQRILRGMALEETKDASARAYWLQQLSRARGPFQRPTVELALALNYERADALAAVFAPKSPIQNADLRDILIRNDAGPPLLRQRVQAADASDHERRLALFVLLYKEITRGRDQAFLADMALMPRDLPHDTDANGQMDDLSLFRWSGTPGGGRAIACPALTALADRLVHAPRDPHPLLCLGEFARLNGLNGYELEQRPPADELGGHPSQFPGQGFSRLEIYKQVIADPKAPKDDRAYALYRAVSCYAPSGVNGCGGVDVPLAQRKQWLKTLKASYGGSPWAGDLKYFW